MTFEEAMSLLKSLGTEQNRKLYSKHGAGENLFGVPFGELNKLAKQIKTDHPLAEKLWFSGNADARYLASMIADPAQITPESAEKWLEGVNYYMVSEGFVRFVLSKTSFAAQLAEKWMNYNDEWYCASGFLLLAILAIENTSFTDEYLAAKLKIIESKIHNSPNRTRHSMNYAVICIGLRNENLQKLAMESAARIGKVHVDHGETSCTTPDAADYIKKTLTRKNKTRPSC